MASPSDHLLRTLAAVPPDVRVLDLGCRAGRRSLPLAQLGFDLYACDADAASVDAARVAVGGVLGVDEAARRVTRAPEAALDYADAFFDWVVAFDLPAAPGAGLGGLLAEIRRVLKPGGWVFVTVPAAVPSGDGAAAGFTPEALGRALEAAGFAEAEAPVLAAAERPTLHAIYRRVDPGTPR